MRVSTSFYDNTFRQNKWWSFVIPWSKKFCILWLIKVVHNLTAEIASQMRCVFFAWRFVNYSVYNSRVVVLAEWKKRIIALFDKINVNILRRTWKSWTTLKKNWYTCWMFATLLFYKKNHDCFILLYLNIIVKCKTKSVRFTEVEKSTRYMHSLSFFLSVVCFWKGNICKSH